jgi:ATP-binding cassette subfamily B protein/subfamily B ATP-binding cassette protein MsbA
VTAAEETSKGNKKARPRALAVTGRLLGACMQGHWGTAALGAGLMLLGTGMSLLQPWPMKYIVNIVSTGHVPSFVHAAAREVGIIIPVVHGPLGEITVLCAALLLISLIAAGITVLSTWLLIAVGLRMVFRLRCRVFEHLQSLSSAFHDSTTVGDSLYRVTWDTYAIQAIFNEGLIPGLTAMVTLAGIAAVMIGQQWMLGAVTFAVGVLLVLFLRRIEKPTTELSLRVHENESSVSTRAEQTLGGIRTVQAFGREKHEADRFARQAAESLKFNLRLTLLQTAGQSVVGVLFALGTVAVIWLTARQVISGRLSPGDVVLMVGYIALLFKPLESLAQTASSLQGAAAGAQRVFEILDRRPNPGDGPNARQLTAPAVGDIEFRQVDFSYPTGRPVLHDINLKIPTGTSLALVGPSGAGKSTLVSLLPRFYDPTSGQVLLDGADIRGLKMESLRRQIAIVPQDPVLFDVTIGENIAYSNPHADMDEIRAAAKAAGALDFIERLPRGMDTSIGERGVMLSGGQRQRLSLARAFLKDAQIIILDEPTTGLDAQTEADLLSALRRLMFGRTTIIISHQLHTVEFVDCIAVLDQGRIVECGRHEELVESHGLYQKLHRLRTQGHPFSGAV